MSKSHPKAVIAAIYSGDIKTIKNYIEKEGVNAMDRFGDTLLSLAVAGEEPNMSVAKLLIDNGANVNIRLREGWTLLHFAAHLLRKDLALTLLRAGCDPNATNDAGETALTKVLFAYNPKADLVEILLEHGADPTMKQPGCESALELATRTGQSNLFPKQ